MKPGDILRVKISGETVQVLKEAKPEGYVSVLRARATRDGIEYFPETMDDFTLEPVEANIDREFREAVYRSELARKGLMIQQAQAHAQDAEQGELFDDDDSDPEEGPLN